MKKCLLLIIIVSLSACSSVNTRSRPLDSSSTIDSSASVEKKNIPKDWRFFDMPDYQLSIPFPKMTKAGREFDNYVFIYNPDNLSYNEKEANVTHTYFYLDVDYRLPDMSLKQLFDQQCKGSPSIHKEHVVEVFKKYDAFTLNRVLRSCGKDYGYFLYYKDRYIFLSWSQDTTEGGRNILLTAISNLRPMDLGSSISQQ